MSGWIALRACGRILEDGIPLTQLAQQQGIPLRTACRWIELYRRLGLVGGFHRFRHRIAGERAFFEQLFADPADGQSGKSLWRLERRGQGKPRAHRKAQKMRPLNVAVIHKSQNIAGHIFSPIGRGIVRLGARAVATAIKGKHANAAPFERAIPA